MPSGGIALSEGDVSKWVKAGAVAVNMGSALISKELMAERRYGDIRAGVDRCIGWIRDAKAMK